MAVRGAGATVVAGIVVARTYQFCYDSRHSSGMGLVDGVSFLVGSGNSGLSP